MPNPPIIRGAGGAANVDCDQLLQDIDRYEKLIASYKRSLESASDPLVRQDLTNGIAIATQVLSALYASYAQHCAHGPVPPPSFHIGPWEPVSNLGIQVGAAWNTGSVWTVLPVSNGRLLVGTEQGGLWLSIPNGQGSFDSHCLSNDWQEWGVSAIVADPANPSNVFVGCGGFDSPAALYSGSVAPTLLQTWSKIALPNALLGGPTPPLSGVTAMIILPKQRSLLVGTNTGLGWTNIDKRRITTSPGGVPDPVFVWNWLPGIVSDLVNANAPGAQEDEFVVIQNGSLLRGTLGSTLNLTAPVSVTWQKTPSQFTPIRLASCKGTLSNNLYCLGLCPNNDGLSGTTGLFVLRSVDGGQHWNECAYTLASVQGLANGLAFLTAGPKSSKSLAVHPNNPLTVAVGYGQVAVSRDGGTTWSFDTLAAPGSHADIHNLHFDELGNLWIPSDGGILQAFESIPLPGSSTRVSSELNRTLPVLMLLPPGAATPLFLGNLSVGGGFIASATQDNNNVWLAPGDQTWRPLDSTGDGGMVALFQDAVDVLVVNGSGGNSIRASWGRHSGSGWIDEGIVPVNLGGSSLDGTGLVGYFRPVGPQVGLLAGPANSPVMALCSGGAIRLPFGGSIFQAAVFGAIDWKLGPPISPTTHTRFVEWVRLGTLPLTETITALEAFDSRSVLAGTQSGRLFLVVVGGSTRELFFDTSDGGQVVGIASDGRTVICARGSLLYAGLVGAQPLVALDANLFPPNGYSLASRGPAAIRGICANRNQKHLGLSFATVVAENPLVLAGSELWVSNSPAAGVWHKAVDGLPASVRAGDLVFSETPLSGQLFLSTFGRSLWSLNF